MAIEDLSIDFTCPECKQEFEIGLYKLLLEWEAVSCPRCIAKKLETESTQCKSRLNTLGKSMRNLVLKL